MMARRSTFLFCLTFWTSLYLQVLSGSEYQIVEGNFTWHQARIDAARRGGHLAVITTSEEWAYVVRLFGRDLLGAYLGGTDEQTEGTWKWITGEPWFFQNWAQKQPDNSSGVQDYLWLHPAYGSAWDDTASDTRSKYLLEIETRYEIVQGSFTWTEAKLDAERRGGHLLTITSEKEWNLVVVSLGLSLWNNPDPLWLGGNNNNIDKRWTWVTSEKWEYTRWLIGEPSKFDRAGRPENYLLTSGGGEHTSWKDGIGDARRGYILEIEASNRALMMGLSLPMVLSKGERSLTFLGHAGRIYVLEASADCSSWANLLLFVATSNGNSFVDSETDFPVRFYRVRDASGASLPPNSLDGRAIRVNVLAGTKPFAASGAYLFQAGPNGTYTVLPQSDTIVGSTGSYTYAKTGGITAIITFSDSVTGNGTAELLFITQTTGTFVIISANTSGRQTGNFILK